MTRDEINKRKIARRVVKTEKDWRKLLKDYYYSEEDFHSKEHLAYRFDYDYLRYEEWFYDKEMRQIDKYSKDLSKDEQVLYDKLYDEYVVGVLSKEEQKKWREERGL